MKKIVAGILLMVMMAVALVGCTAKGGAENKSIIMVWYPNESGEDLKGARDALGKVVEKATGKKVEHKLTTDYVIAIEALATGNAHIAFLGAQGYIEAHKKNPKVLPLVVNSGKSGTLADAQYYSWLCVKRGNEVQYKNGETYSIDNIQGKRFSFVSSSSTSGFQVPASGIVSHFSKKENWKNLKQEDLTEGGKDKFFSEVLFGGSHQGSAVNLLTDKADVAAFCDTCVANYVELVEGTANKPGAVYRVRKDAAEPFDKVPGAEFVLISSTPVLNAPFAVNTEKVSEKDVKALLAMLTSDEVAKNQEIFVPKGSSFKGLFVAGERFVEVKDEWFNPIRELSK